MMDLIEKLNEWTQLLRHINMTMEEAGKLVFPHLEPDQAELEMEKVLKGGVVMSMSFVAHIDSVLERAHEVYHSENPSMHPLEQMFANLGAQQIDEGEAKVEVVKLEVAKEEASDESIHAQQAEMEGGEEEEEEDFGDVPDEEVIESKERPRQTNYEF